MVCLNLTLVLASRQIVVAAITIVFSDHLDPSSVLRLAMLVSTFLVFTTFRLRNVEPAKVLLGNLCLRGLRNWTWSKQLRLRLFLQIHFVFRARVLFLSGRLVDRLVQRITSFVIAARVYVYTSFLFIFEIFFSTFYRVNSLFHCFRFIQPFGVFFTVFSICIFILLTPFR